MYCMLYMYMCIAHNLGRGLREFVSGKRACALGPLLQQQPVFGEQFMAEFFPLQTNKIFYDYYDYYYYYFCCYYFLFITAACFVFTRLPKKIKKIK